VRQILDGEEEATTMDRRTFLKAGGAAIGVAALPGRARGQAAPSAIRIGYAISLSGPFAPGAQSTSWSQYKLWAKDVNDAGGIHLKKYERKIPVELIEYDDRSQPDEVIRLVERLILQDKVDFILPPWGTHMNLAIAPVINKHEYPVIFFTATALRIRELAKRWPYAFFPLAQPDDSAAPLGTMLASLKSQGKIKGRVAAVHVAEQTGVELHSSFGEACKKNGIEVVYSKSYPLGVSDLSPLIREAMQTQPDGFFAFSYPTDTFMLAEQSSVLGFNPPIYYSAVGTPFPAFKAKLGDKVNGVLLWGGLDHKAAGLAEYRQRHRAMYNRDTESGAVGMYATVQVLQQAIERVGEIDRKKVRNEIATGSFPTIFGTLKFKDQLLVDPWTVGQWQNGEVVGVFPAQKPNAQALLFPKPKW
jgi:branched-chain amino acid transport system substrate-binding protein